MKILILGAGKMGSFFTDLLNFDHETAVYDTDPKQLKFIYHTYRFSSLSEVENFKPELVINAVTLKYTIEAFKSILPLLPKNCILSDIASVKNDLRDFYRKSGFDFVSTHPMFGPTFASLNHLNEENAIIINEGSAKGIDFFRKLYAKLNLNIFEYSFEKHDETMAYALSTPFVSTLVFSSIMKHQEAPGTTFKKHMTIAKGLLGEDDFLLQEILFNDKTTAQIEKIQFQLRLLSNIISNREESKLKKFLTDVRKNIE